jgi:hypothetical protein
VALTDAVVVDEDVALWDAVVVEEGVALMEVVVVVDGVAAELTRLSSSRAWSSRRRSWLTKARS